MLELAENGYITSNRFSRFLVKNHEMSFRNAYQITSLIVNFAEKRKKIKPVRFK